MRLAILIGLAGCGRIGFDAAGPADARNDAVGDDASDAADGPPPACASDARYVVIAGLSSRYRTSANDRSWAAARADCEADGAHLTILDDATEAGSGAVGDWVGLTDAAQEGTWRTVAGGVATFLPWQPGQPDGGSEEDCARLEEGSSQLEDRDCGDVRDYSCECE